MTFRFQSSLYKVLLILIMFSWNTARGQWIIEKCNDYSLQYSAIDGQNISAYKPYFELGKKTVEDFFQDRFKNDFSITIHSSRLSLDSTWQRDWNAPGFNSQCWMVASGVATKLDIISPKLWDSLACEHVYSDSIETQRLITHELVHVFHGQQNASPDFSDVTGIDWFVEGLAVYASGQYDSVRVSQVKAALSENKIPQDLTNFWSGQFKYGLSGSVVMYIDKTYGREMLISLLKYNDLGDITDRLYTTKEELRKNWEAYIKTF